MTESKKKSTLKEWRNALVFAVIVATLFRWSLAEAYEIPTGSMENSLLVGDYILVSKIHFGPRTPQTPLQIPLTHQKIWGTDIPSYLDWVQLPAWRLPGIREVKRGETLVFNVPKDLLDPTERPSDLMTYLVKRCVALPGDFLEIRDSRLIINGEAVKNPKGVKFQYDITTSYPLQAHQWEAMGLDGDDHWFLGYTETNKAAYGMLLTASQKSQLLQAPYLESIHPVVPSEGGLPLFPTEKNGKWSAASYGPLLVPKKGLTIQIDSETSDLYADLIQNHEGNEMVGIENGIITIDGEPLQSYTFKQNYYFMMGDSRDNSIDSRFWGFLPEDHLVGKPVMVIWSKDPEKSGLDWIRWERIFSRIE